MKKSILLLLTLGINLETPSKKQSKRKKLIVILASVLCLLGGVWTYFHYRDADIEDWVVGFWTYDGYGCDLFVDSAGNGYIDVYNEYWWNSRLSKLQLKVRRTIYLTDLVSVL